MATLSVDSPKGERRSGLAPAPPAYGSDARTRAIVWLTLAFWGSMLAVMTIGTALSGNERLPEITGMRVLTTLSGLFLCYLIHLLLTNRRLHSLRRRIIALALVAPVAAELFAWVSYFGDIAADPTLRSSFSCPRRSGSSPSGHGFSLPGRDCISRCHTVSTCRKSSSAPQS